MPKQILSIGEATKAVCKELNVYPQKVMPTNQNRYSFLKVNDKWILVVYKRKPYLTYSRIEEEKGFGETINTQDLRDCIKLNAECIYIVYSNDRIYRTTITDILNNSISRFTEAENKEVRSFNMKLLKNVKEV
jgi:hypothetical protein